MSNHLGDANKMVGDTPRTDAHNWHDGDYDDPLHAFADFAKQLERELNAASKERDDSLMMLGMYRMKSDEQKQRIKRLEEAGDELLRDNDDMSNINRWWRAKEAKP